jgi:Putative metal-binding motif
VCNGIDDNCDGAVDEGVQSTFYLDADGDGHGTTPVAACEGAGLAAVGGDCDDTSSTVWPGAPEVCGDGVDQDCDGADPACR